MRFVWAVALACTGCSALFGLDAPTLAGDAAVTDMRTVDGPPPDASKSCLADWHAGIVSFVPAQPIAELNTTASEANPYIDETETTMYFASDRAGSQMVDMWIATRASRDLPWGLPERASAFNTSELDSRASLTSDQLLALVLSNRAGTEGMNDIWLASRASVQDPFGAFSQAAVMNINDAANQDGAVLAPDGLTIYVQAGGGLGYSSRSSRVVPFPAPTVFVELGTGAGERDPAVSLDSRVIVFASNRAGNLGGGDLYYATRPTATSPWGTPVHLVALATTALDIDPFLSADGCTLYFASDRMGSADFYVARVNPN